MVDVHDRLTATLARRYFVVVAKEVRRDETRIQS